MLPSTPIKGSGAAPLGRQHQSVKSANDRARARGAQNESGPDEAVRVDIESVEGAREDQAVAGFGLDLAYNRQTVRLGRGGQGAASGAGERGAATVAQSTSVSTSIEVEFRFSLAVLPRDAEGNVDPAAVEKLANTEQRNDMLDSLERIAEEGLREPGALAMFMRAVDSLFAEYGADLALDPAELEGLRDGFVNQVTDFFQAAEAQAGGRPALSAGVPESLAADLRTQFAGLRESLLAQREDVLLAAGDSSRALAELAADATAAPEDDDRAERLGRFVGGLERAGQGGDPARVRRGARARLTNADTAASESRSTLEAAAERARKLVAPPENTVPESDPVALARRFLAGMVSG